MTVRVPAATPTRMAPDERAAVEDAVRRVLAGGPWIGGPEVTAFEEELGTALGAAHVVGCASGTDALVLALAALVPEGAEVLVPGHDGGYGATAARLAGLIPVPVDVEPGTGGASAAALDAAAAGRDVGAVVAVHLHGDPADLAAIDAWRRDRGIPLVEDCAQAIGARWAGRHVGTIGAAGAFSFYPTKNLGAAGDAGAVVFADADAAGRARSLAQYGWGERYRVELPRGRNSRLDPLQAAVLRARLPFLAARTERRVAVRARYVAAAPHLRFLGGEPGSVAHHAVVVTEHRDALASHLAAAGVATGIHYPVAVADMPGLATAGAPTPHARRLAVEVLSLPCTPELHDDEADAVCAALSAWGAT